MNVDGGPPNSPGTGPDPRRALPVRVRGRRPARGGWQLPWLSHVGPQVPIVSVTVVIVVGAILIWQDHWRKGAMLLGFAMLLGALWRAALPDTRVGLLRVRGRGFDVGAMLVVGAVIVWLAWSINPLGTG